MASNVLKKVTRKDIILLVVVGLFVLIDFFSRVFLYSSEPLKIASDAAVEDSFNGKSYGQLSEQQQQQITDYFVAYDAVKNKQNDADAHNADSQQAGKEPTNPWRKHATRIGDQDFRLVAVLTGKPQQRQAVLLRFINNGSQADTKKYELRVGDMVTLGGSTDTSGSVVKLKVANIRSQSVTLTWTNEQSGEEKQYVLPLFPRTESSNANQQQQNTNG